MENLESLLTPFPKVQLAHTPTPLELLPNLSKHLGGPQIYIKRDDCTGLATGGNKARKLEFLLGDALARGADTIITVGAYQSNHARQTAAAAAKCGLNCELILTDSVPFRAPEYRTSGNLLLDRLTGARVTLLPEASDPQAHIEEVSGQLRNSGKVPYTIPVGGSNPMGVLGYVSAAEELHHQLQELGIPVDWIVVPTGSGGTQSGLILGMMLLESGAEVLGVSVSRAAEKQMALVEGLTRETMQLLHVPPERLGSGCHVDDNFIGPGYGQPTEGMLEAVQLLARLEGILIDPVYTGKAMAGLIDMIRNQKFTSDHSIVFLHTGGSAGLFAYERELQG